MKTEKWYLNARALCCYTKIRGGVSNTDLNIFSRTGPWLMPCQDTQYLSTIVGRTPVLYMTQEKGSEHRFLCPKLKRTSPIQPSPNTNLLQVCSRSSSVVLLLFYASALLDSRIHGCFFTYNHIWSRLKKMFLEYKFHRTWS